MPVCSGSRTGCRPATPGALISTGRRSRGDDRALAVERIAQRIEHAADHRVAHRHAQQLAGAADLVPFLDVQVIAENDHADGVLFQVERQADGPAGELDHLAGHHAGQAVDARNAVAHLQHATDLADVDLRLVVSQFPSARPKRSRRL